MSLDIIPAQMGMYFESEKNRFSGGNTMISLRLMEDTMEDYTAMRNWFLEPDRE